jgi:predicted CopG family antitoxin
VGLLLDDKQIKVSDYVAEKLEEIKRKQQHKSMDSVIRMLIQVYEAQKHDS